MLNLIPNCELKNIQEFQPNVFGLIGDKEVTHHFNKKWEKHNKTLYIVSAPEKEISFSLQNRLQNNSSRNVLMDAYVRFVTPKCFEEGEISLLLTEKNKRLLKKKPLMRLIYIS